MGSETPEEAGKAQGWWNEYIGGHEKVDGSERVQQGASGKYDMKVGKRAGEPREY